MQKDLFAPVPEFLAAYNNILENGFFEEIKFTAGSVMMEGKIHSCFVSISGCVPNHEKYRADGCGTLIDPNAVIATCRRLAGQNQIKHLSTSIETEDWRLWDAKGNNIVGSKGHRTKLSLQITFKT